MWEWLVVVLGPELYLFVVKLSANIIFGFILDLALGCLRWKLGPHLTLLNRLGAHVPVRTTRFKIQEGGTANGSDDKP